MRAQESFRMTAKFARTSRSDLQASLLAAVSETDASKVHDTLLRFVSKAQAAEATFDHSAEDPVDSVDSVDAEFAAWLTQTLRGAQAHHTQGLMALREYLNNGDGRVIQDLLSNHHSPRLARASSVLAMLNIALDSLFPTPHSSPRREAKEPQSMTSEVGFALQRHLWARPKEHTSPVQLADMTLSVELAQDYLRWAMTPDPTRTQLARGYAFLRHVEVLITVSVNADEIAALQRQLRSLKMADLTEAQGREVQRLSTLANSVLADLQKPC